MLNQFKSFSTRLTLTHRFMVVSLVVVVVGLVGIGAWVANEIQAGVVNRTGATTALFVNSFVAPHLQSLVSGETLSDEDSWALSQLLKDTDFGRQIVAFKVWDLTGMVLYSTDPAAVGQQFELREDVLRSARGEVSSALSNLDEPENAPLRAIAPRLLETYSPVRRTGANQIIAIAEFYQRGDALEQEMAAARARSWLVVGGAMLAIYVLLVVFVARLDRILQRQQRALNGQVTRLTELLGQVRELDERVRRAAGRTTAVNERFLRRISAELHDGPAQDLALALLRMDHVIAGAEAGAEQKLSGRTDDGEDLQIIQRALDSSIKEIRAIAAGLGVPNLDRLSLVEILRRVAREHERKTATKVALAIGDLPLRAPLPVKITLYRLVQEALSNAYRHSGGAGQQVQASATAGQLKIDIVDQGPGFDYRLANGSGEHLGLVGMRERVESLGGQFEIMSGPGQGTRVIAQLPLQVEEETEEEQVLT